MKRVLNERERVRERKSCFEMWVLTRVLAHVNSRVMSLFACLCTVFVAIRNTKLQEWTSTCASSAADSASHAEGAARRELARRTA